MWDRGVQLSHESVATLVEVIGFEPTAPALRRQCSTGLSYTPRDRAEPSTKGPRCDRSEAFERTAPPAGSAARLPQPFTRLLLPVRGQILEASLGTDSNVRPAPRAPSTCGRRSTIPARCPGAPP